jgi:hypothetical protein
MLEWVKSHETEGNRHKSESKTAAMEGRDGRVDGGGQGREKANLGLVCWPKGSWQNYDHRRLWEMRTGEEIRGLTSDALLAQQLFRPERKNCPPVRRLLKNHPL